MQSNYETKSIVPYGYDFFENVLRPKPINIFKFFSQLIREHFGKRFKTYLLLFYSFLSISVLTFILANKYYSYGIAWLTEYDFCDISSLSRLIASVFTPLFCFSSILFAFFGGFTSFSFPVAFISFLRLLATRTFFFSIAALGFDSRLDFYFLAFAFLYALQILLDVAFFSETAHFHSSVKFNVKGISFYSCFFLVYIVFTFTLLYFQLSLLS